MKTAWDTGERVLALKIAIQCAKLLNDTSVPQFYPSMYVLLTAVLDTFGDLVYERIKRKGVVVQTAGGKTVASALPHDFQASDVSLNAKETCRNWFYKTACIRELMPRLYVDLALIKSYRFLGEETFPDILTRVSKSIRGIGDPMAAAYMRAYLATKAGDVWASFQDPKQAKIGKNWFMPSSYLKPLLMAFDDFLFTYRHYKATNWEDIAHIKEKRVELDVYIDLFSPAVAWLLQNIGYKSKEDIFFALLQQYKDTCNNSSVLLPLLSSFDPKFIAKQALSMTTLIREADPNLNTPKPRLYLVLGKALVQCPPPQEQALPILNDKIGRAVQQECRDRSRMPSSA
eukprot:TRINITY_DN7076_c0_g2_i1.p1 TRINITY_DN7076_c0_g2~~TRINITY_DN7076_c0_g2_i1.p1  ORF type:complete len:377 (+),score=71.48 TRINITY_DN7076_c0_g2_i1:101-1132(+)